METQVNKVIIKKKAKGDGSSSIKISKEYKIRWVDHNFLH